MEIWLCSHTQPALHADRLCGHGACPLPQRGASWRWPRLLGRGGGIVAGRPVVGSCLGMNRRNNGTGQRVSSPRGPAHAPSTVRRRPKRPRLREIIGPGLITGASDDDPSGIATYSQAGAGFGFGLCWSMFAAYPLMAAVQMISARIGRTTGHGIAGNVARFYPKWLLTSIVTLLLVANTINIGADLGAMADVTAL